MVHVLEREYYGKKKIFFCKIMYINIILLYNFVFVFLSKSKALCRARLHDHVSLAVCLKSKALNISIH